MSASTKRRRSGINPLLALLLIIVGALGVVATLHFTDRVRFDAIDRLLGKEVQAAAPVERVAIPIGVRALEPGHAVTRSDLWNPQTGIYHVLRVPRELVREEWIRNPLEIEGRVLAGPKRAEKAFREEDFLPIDSSAGPVGLVPDGMRLFMLDAEKVKGLDVLGFRDRFDLMAVVKVDDGIFAEAEKLLEQRGTKDLAARVRLEEQRNMASYRPIVQSGVMLQALDRDANRRGKQAAVAIRPEEVPALLEALNLDHELHCFGLSGRAGGEIQAGAQIPEQEPPMQRLEWVWGSVHEVGVMKGTERTTVTVPKEPAQEMR